ncbi:MAG: TetR/AcrR family transcriptional regulator [Xanthobacteraceae bacterium]
MPPSRKHHNRIRDPVLRSAGRLFNRHGFNAVSIDDVMAEAGLTRGSFYCYFSSKSDLYAQSVARVVHEDCENLKGSGSERTRADKIVHDYLSEADQDATADTFPMIGLPNDMSRTDRAVRQAFEGALKLMIQSFEQAANGNADARRECARHRRALCRRHGFCRARSMTASWPTICGVLPKRPRSTLANGEHGRYCGQADSQRASIFSCESTIGIPAIAALLCTVAV